MHKIYDIKLHKQTKSFAWLCVVVLDGCTSLILNANKFFVIDLLVCSWINWFVHLQHKTKLDVLKSKTRGQLVSKKKKVSKKKPASPFVITVLGVLGGYYHHENKTLSNTLIHSFFSQNVTCQ
jgi:hypothetical protein